MRQKQTNRHEAGIPKVADALKRPAKLAPLSDSELVELACLLDSTHLGRGMNIEEVDGFFAGLIAGPQVPKPCQYWPVVLGKDVGDPSALDYIRKTTLLLPFFARHWDSISETLLRGDLHVPYLSENSEGLIMGRDWARGFMHAVELRAECWQPLLNDELYVAALLPMMILAHEDDSDPLLRSPPINDVQRESLIRQMAGGVVRSYLFFTQLQPSDKISPPENLH